MEEETTSAYNISFFSFELFVHTENKKAEGMTSASLIITFIALIVINKFIP